MDANLIKPRAVKLPNRSMLQVLKALGVMMIAGSLAIVGWIIYAELFRDNSYNWEGTGMGWPYWAVPLAVGFLLALLSFSTYTHYYEEVLQGQVVNHGHSANYANGMVDSFYLYIRGYTLAGELHTYALSVKPYTWKKIQVGDYVDFRK